MEDCEMTKPKPKDKEQKPWKPNDLEVDPERQARLKQKMEISMQKLESSKFYTAFMEQLKSPKVSDQFRLVLGNETQFKMVIYGIGKIESDESPWTRLQLGIAILMKREFDWIGDNIEVFDPVLSTTETNLLESLGFTVLYVNEQCRREALKPTIFFMPHCDAILYTNLLRANWKVDRLSRIVLFGNSFKNYERRSLSAYGLMRETKVIRATRRFTTEFAIKKTESDGEDVRYSFNDLSLHFFSCAIDSELPLSL